MSSDTDIKEITDLKVAVGVISSEMKNTRGVVDRIETKIDNMTYVTKSDFDEYKKESKDTYVTKETFEPIKQAFYKFVGLVVGGVLLAVLALVVGTKS